MRKVLAAMGSTAILCTLPPYWAILITANCSLFTEPCCHFHPSDRFKTYSVSLIISSGQTGFWSLKLQEKESFRQVVVKQKRRAGISLKKATPDRREAMRCTNNPCHPERSECGVKDLLESIWGANQRTSWQYSTFHKSALFCIPNTFPRLLRRLVWRAKLGRQRLAKDFVGHRSFWALQSFCEFGSSKNFHFFLWKEILSVCGKMLQES